MSLYEERKRLEQEDGEPLHTLRITPDFEAAVPYNGAGIVVVAGEWGLQPDDERLVVKPLAELGYFVVAIDLVRGEQTTSAETAAARRAAIKPEIALDDVAAAILYLKELAGGKIGVIGLDAAADVAIEAAARLPQIDAVVVAGATGPRPGTRMSRTRASILALRGKSSPLGEETCAAIQQRMQAAKQTLMVHDYDAADGFFTRPKDDAERDEATMAFERTTDFLAQTLI